MGIGLAALLVAFPVARQLVMPAAITLRNVPYVALVTVLSARARRHPRLEGRDRRAGGLLPGHGEHATVASWPADPVVLDRMRVLSASALETSSSTSACPALPHIVSAQEITGSGSIIVAIAAEWMISGSGLGYVINRAMQQYRGDQVYAVALLAALLSFLVYSAVHVIGAAPRLAGRGARPRVSANGAPINRVSRGGRTLSGRRADPSPPGTSRATPRTRGAWPRWSRRAW